MEGGAAPAPETEVWAPALTPPLPNCPLKEPVDSLPLFFVVERKLPGTLAVLSLLVLRPFRGKEDITYQTLIASQQEDMMNYYVLQM